MSDGHACQSCTMTIESGDYCQYCTTDEGELIAYEECVERFTQFTLRRQPDLPREEAVRETHRFMSTMPAWKDHPRLAEERAE